MMWRRVGCLCALLVVLGCGQAEPSITGLVRVSGLLQDEVETIRLWVFGPMRTDDVFLTCPNLSAGEVDPEGDLVEPLGQATVDFGAEATRSAEITGVASGEGRILFARASGSGEARLATGCVEDISVEPGGATEVDVTLYRTR